jgi:signal transduction histidine kinase
LGIEEEDAEVGIREAAACADPAPEARIAELEAMVAGRDAFLAVVAHELRNPMTPVLGQVQRLLRLSRGGAGVGELEPGLARLEWLIDRYVRRATILLDVSRIRSGRVALQPEDCDLVEIARGVIAASEPVAAYLGVAVTLTGPDGLAGHWDRLAVEQILDNLLANAIKYGDGKPVTVSIRPEGGHAAVTVADRGIGIREEDRHRIFDRFERVGEQVRAGGFGVGLWLVRQLVTAMAGSIEVSGNPGEGSAFTVMLPVKPALGQPGMGGGL